MRRPAGLELLLVLLLVLLVGEGGVQFSAAQYFTQAMPSSAPCFTGVSLELDSGGLFGRATNCARV